MKKSVWKIQPMPKPTQAHAADAIEIVNGEPVRRVTLPQLDYDIYVAYEAAKGTNARELAASINMPADVIAAALHRLAAAGLVTPGVTPTIQ